MNTMNAKTALKRYMAPPTAAVVLSIILAAALLVTLAGIVVSLGFSDGEPAEFFPSDSEKGSYCWVDVAGISDWITRIDGEYYYIVQDGELYYYAVIVSPSVYETLDEQSYWWSHDQEPMPATVRLSGVVESVPEYFSDTVCEVFDLPAGSFSDYFGLYLLDTTETPGTKASTFWTLGAAVSGLGLLICLLTGLSPVSQRNKSLKRLDALGMTELAAAQLMGENSFVIGKDKARLTNDFLISKTGVAVAIGDIVWAYARRRSYNFIPTDVSLVLNTNTRKNLTAVSMPGTDPNGTIDWLLMTLAQRSPNIMVGYGPQNKAAYRAFSQSPAGAPVQPLYTAPVNTTSPVPQPVESAQPVQPVNTAPVNAPSPVGSTPASADAVPAAPADAGSAQGGTPLN